MTVQFKVFIISGAIWLIWLALAILFALIDSLSYQYDILRFVLLATLTLVGSVSFFILHNFSWQRSGTIWLIAWAFMLLLSSFFMPNGRHTWLEIYQNTAYSFTFVGLGYLLVQKQYLASALISFIHVLPVVTFVYAVGCVYTYIFALFDQQANLATFLPWGFINIRYWSQVASWVIPLLPLSLLLSPLRHNGRWQFLVYCTLAIWVWVLILSSARGSILALILSIGICLLLFKQAAKPWALILAKGAVFGVLTWLVLSVGIHAGLLGLTESIGEIRTSGSGRWPLYIEALAMSWQNFPLGMGPFSWLTHAPLTDIYASSHLFGHPHNMILLWAAEYGWLAVAALCGLAWHALLKVRFLLARRATNVELIGLTASVLAACIHSNFSAVFITPYSLMIGLGVLSLFWGLLHQYFCTDSTQTEHNQNIFKPSKILALFILLGGLANLLHSYQYYQLNRTMLEQKIHTLQGLSAPRFFQDSILLKE